MALPTFYATGTASVTNGATTITFSGAILGTEAQPNIMPGDLFLNPAQATIPPQRIASVDYDAGTATLAVNWPGTTMSSAAYEVRYVGIVERSTAQTRRLLEELSVVEANGRGLFYVFSDTTTDADPGAGIFRLNNATQSSATGAFLDNLDANGATVSAVIDTWDNAGSTDGRGQLWLRSIAAPSTFRAFDVTGTVVDGTGYRKLTLAHIGGSGTLAPGDEVMLSFLPLGQGATGAPGTNGTNGTNGVDGTGFFTRIRAVSTSNITISTALNNGDSIDGVTLVTNDLVLVTGQSTAADNGVYVVGASPARDSSFDTYDEHPGAYFSVMEGTANADTLWRCTSNKGGTIGSTALVFSQFTAGGSGGGDVTNLGLAITVGSSALTIALKQADGSTDPAIGTGAVKAKMRSSTLATGAVIERSATSALSLVIPSTATMGRTNALVGHLYHYLIDNAGTLELAVSGRWFGKAGIITTTTIGTGSDSGDVMYSTTGRSNVPFICIGRSIDTQTTAGTWAAVPSTIEIDPKVRFPVAFSANRTSNQTIATSTATKVQFSNEENDVGGFYDNATNYRWRPPAGIYEIGASIHLSTGADTAFLDGMIYKNGANHKVLGRIRFPGAVSNSVSGAARVVANGTDYFELFVFHNIGSSADVYADPPFSFWWGQSVEEY